MRMNLRLRLMLCMALFFAQILLLSQALLMAQGTSATRKSMRELDFFSVNKMFTNNMVLQREKPIHIWGKGLPGATVRVTLSINATERNSASASKSTSAAASKGAVARPVYAVAHIKPDSSWSVYLPAQPASSHPRNLKIICGKKNILINNVLLGDIWLCIGQSNMEWPMQREMYYREAMVTANQPLLRFYNPTYAGKNIFNQYFSDSVLQMMTPEKFFAPTSWQVSDSNSFKAMSAVAYYYGKSILEATEIPIGLINLSIAGASLETFIGVDALKSHPLFAAKAIEPWLTNTAMPEWVKERGNQNLRTGTDHPFKPGHLYEAGIKPLFPLAIKGIINYQGESNAQEYERVYEYAGLTELMVNDYRARFKNAILPFYFVQLSSIDSVKYKGQYWHFFRDEERKILDQLSNTGMAVCTDYGLKDNVHPANKKVVGERLAKWALNKSYGVSLIPSGPLPKLAQYANGKLTIAFNYVGGGLETADGKTLRGFSLDGYSDVSARIVDEHIVIDCAEQPKYVYYNWKPYTDGNLVNKEKLPASTFKLLVERVKVVLPLYADLLFNTYYHQKYSLFKSLPNTSAALPISKRDIIFLGNSINDGSEWSELFNNIRIKNRGISGDITKGILHRLKEVTSRKPAKVFLMIGINDLGRGESPDSVVKNILLINDFIIQESPTTKVFIESILPVNSSFGRFAAQVSKVKEIIRANELLKAAAASHGYEYINLHDAFVDAQGLLDKKYTNDGLHLTGAGYQHWRHLIYPKVLGLTEKPALIPMPTQVNWKSGYFTLQAGKLLKEQVNIILPQISKELVNRKDSFSTNEAYELIVRANQIIIKAASQHGVFNAMQTLEQLVRNGQTIDAVEIKDSPAFAWRGYMIDVGRNYLSMDLLKQQIDVMSKYKLNVFHFHATEDIAWRIAIKKYPQLTAPENMLRNKGMYYSEAEIKELIAYCTARNILFVPEIDMPGHSAAFKRAMKTDMQSDSGMVYVKNILKEFCATYDVPYIHIGADEVKITNPNFIPEITRYIQSLGKKVIGWQPGGNFLDNTIRQLWMDDLGKVTNDKQVQYIDSRHLYLNHMDPLEAVTTIFNRQLANRESGDSNALGAIICTWHDRAVAKEEDVLKMNPVYPAMLAFAERSWKGGGQLGWISNISDGDINGFVEFEQRLLNHQQQNFQPYSSNKSDYSFPYQPQASIEWKLYDANEKYIKTVKGGTIVLRHWWAPLIKGAIDTIKPNQVWHAYTQIWSDENTTKPFWIGFNNLSRSPATDSPPAFAWNEYDATVAVNGNVILPPLWKGAGQKGHLEIPLVDEGYEYRAPTMIKLAKGWNDVRIKIPIGKLNGKDWQNPAKYMFTFVPVAE